MKKKDCDSCEFYDARNDRCSSNRIDMCESVGAYMRILKELAHLGLVCPGYIEKENKK